jgi:hypothetical protein
MSPPVRSAAQRLRDTLHRLEHDVDAWVATAEDGIPYLVPLSFLWRAPSAGRGVDPVREGPGGRVVLIATPTASRTGRNLLASGKARLGLGLTRDVVLVEGTVRALDEVPGDVGDAFAAKTGFDPRVEPNPYTFFEITPVRVQAWREADELTGRVLMRDGRWIEP